MPSTEPDADRMTIFECIRVTSSMNSQRHFLAYIRNVAGQPLEGKVTQSALTIVGQTVSPKAEWGLMVRQGDNVGRVPDALNAARDEARRLVEPLGRRWKHLAAVGLKGESLGPVVGLDSDLLGAACWLHDVGYAPELMDTGMHAIDGARYLRRTGWDERIVSMVAHHSCALLEAEERGLRAELAEFDRPPREYEDAVCFCDMTTGPAGADVRVPDRLDEIEVRYGPDHLVTRFIRRARPEILAAASRIEDRRTSGAPRSA